MTRDIYVTITKEHIAAGVKKSPTMCPVALAVNSQYIGEGTIEIYPTGWKMPRGHWWPVDLSKEIERFDTTGELEPFTLRICEGEGNLTPVPDHPTR